MAGSRWKKGRRLSAEDLVALATAEPGQAVSVIVADPGELHEDDAALRLAKAVVGQGLTSGARTRAASTSSPRPTGS